MSLRKKPWNRVNLPVYSLCTGNAIGGFNMHICTYVTAVSMHPKRIMVAVYHGTKTLHNLQQTGTGVLQLMEVSQYNLVNLLGKQSGHEVNKIERLQKRGLISTWNGFPILQEALAVMELQAINTMEAGDHCMYLFDVPAYKNLNDGTPLTTSLLHEKGIIRI